MITSQALTCARRLATGMVFFALLQPAWAAEPVRVRAEPFEQLALYPTQAAPATVLSLNDTTLSAETAGRVATIAVRVGDAIQPGQALLSLDCRDQRISQQRAEAEQTRARAAMALAERQLKRARALAEQDSVSQELVDQRDNERILAQAQYDNAQAGLSAARLAVERCNLVAPFRGVVLQRLTAVGAWVQPGTPLLQVLDTQRLAVSAQVPASQVPNLQAAEQIWLQDDGQRFPLAVRALVAALDPQARSREVRLEFVEQTVLPGTAGRVVWQDARPHVPADLLVQRAGQLGVFVVDGRQARFVALPGASEGSPALADSLKDGVRLITDGRYGLQDGDAIEE